MQLLVSPSRTVPKSLSTSTVDKDELLQLTELVPHAHDPVYSFCIKILLLQAIKRFHRNRKDVGMAMIIKSVQCGATDLYACGIGYYNTIIHSYINIVHNYGVYCSNPTQRGSQIRRWASEVIGLPHSLFLPFKYLSDGQNLPLSSTNYYMNYTNQTKYKVCH